MTAWISRSGLAGVFVLAALLTFSPDLAWGQYVPGIGTMPGARMAIFAGSQSTPSHCRPNHCYPGNGWVNRGWGLGWGYGYGYGLGGVAAYSVPTPVPYPVPVPVQVAPQSNGYVDAPRAVLSTVQVPSASGRDPIYIDVIRGERGPSRQLPFTRPRPAPGPVPVRPTPATTSDVSTLAREDSTPAELKPSAPAVEEPVATPVPLRVPTSDLSTPELVEFLADDQPAMQVHAMDLLLKRGKEGRAEVARAAADANPQVRAIALWGLAQVEPSSEDVARIVTAMKDESAGVREQAVRLVAGLDAALADQARQPLLAALDDAEEDVRLAASESLAVFGTKIIPDLLTTLESDREATRDAAGRALIRLGASSVRPLEASLASAKPHVRYWAAYSLGEIGEPAVSARGALEQMARTDPDSNVRYYAVAAVRKLTF